MSFGAIVYVLCMSTSMTCAGLLVRAYLRSRAPLLLWTSFGFAAMALNNLLLVIDLLLLPSVDLWIWRQASSGFAIFVFLYGFIWKVRP